MSWESIGCCGGGHSPDEQDWKMACLEMGLGYLKHVVRVLPEGCQLGIMWNEVEGDRFATLGLQWGAPLTEPPAELIHQCELLLQRFDEAIDWVEIDPDHAVAALEDEFGSDDEDEYEDDEYDDEDEDDEEDE